MIILAIFRLIMMTLTMSVYAIIVFIISLFVGDLNRASTHLRTPVIRVIMYLLGVRIRRSGSLPQGTVLFIGNHVSYLDPFILVYHILAMPVAKAEVASWPFIGYVCAISGVLFVKRRHAGSLRATRAAIAERLKAGDSIIVYPEGTTTNGKQTLPFSRGIFDMAADLSVPVVPVTITYRQPEASFVRSDTFLPHFLNLFSRWYVEAHIHFDEKIKGDEGKLLMEKTRAIVDKKLKELTTNV